MQKLKQLRKLPFCKALKHAVVITILLKIVKKQTIIDSCLYETNKHVKVHNILEICPHNDGFSPTTLDTLALLLRCKPR